MDPLTTCSIVCWQHDGPWRKRLNMLKCMSSQCRSSSTPDSASLVTVSDGDGDEVILLWNGVFSSSPARLQPFAMLKAELGSVHTVRFIDSMLIVSGHANGMALWDCSQLVCLRTHTQSAPHPFTHIEPLMPAHRSKSTTAYIFCARADAKIYQFELDSFRAVRCLLPVEPGRDLLGTRGMFTFNKNGEDLVVVIALLDGLVRLWSFASNTATTNVNECDHQIVRKNVKKMTSSILNPRHILLIARQSAVIVDATNFEEVSSFYTHVDGCPDIVDGCFLPPQPQNSPGTEHIALLLTNGQTFVLKLTKPLISIDEDDRTNTQKFSMVGFEITDRFKPKANPRCIECSLDGIYIGCADDVHFVPYSSSLRLDEDERKIEEVIHEITSFTYISAGNRCALGLRNGHITLLSISEFLDGSHAGRRLIGVRENCSINALLHPNTVNGSFHADLLVSGATDFSVSVWNMSDSSNGHLAQ